MLVNPILENIRKVMEGFNDKEQSFVNDFVNETVGRFYDFDEVEVIELGEKRFDIEIEGMKPKEMFEDVTQLVGDSVILQRLEEEVKSKYGYTLSLKNLNDASGI